MLKKLLFSSILALNLFAGDAAAMQPAVVKTMASRQQQQKQKPRPKPAPKKEEQKAPEQPKQEETAEAQEQKAQNTKTNTQEETKPANASDEDDDDDEDIHECYCSGHIPCDDLCRCSGRAYGCFATGCFIAGKNHNHKYECDECKRPMTYQEVCDSPKTKQYPNSFGSWMRKVFFG